MADHEIDGLDFVSGTTYTRQSEEWGGCLEYLSYAGENESTWTEDPRYYNRECTEGGNFNGKPCLVLNRVCWMNPWCCVEGIDVPEADKVLLDFHMLHNMLGNFNVKAAIRVRFCHFDPDDREASTKKENFTHVALHHQLPTPNGMWADRDQHVSEHIASLEVPEEFHGKKMAVFVEVINKSGMWKMGWHWEGVAIFVNAPNHD